MVNKVILEYGISGLPTLRLEGKSVRYMHSRYDPILEAQRIVDAWEIPESITHLCVIGLGLGYHLRECRNRYPNVQVAIIECNVEVLQAARGVMPDLFQDSRMTVVLPHNEQEFSEFIARQDIENVRLHPPSVDVLPYPHLRSLLQEMQVIQTSTRRTATKMYENWQRNADHLIASNIVTGQRGIWRNRPGVLIAAGPSLEMEIPALKKLITLNPVSLCVTRVLQPLLMNGIVPTATVATEASHVLVKHFAGLEQHGFELPPLFALPTVHPKIVQRYTGKVQWVLQLGVSYVEDYAKQSGMDLMQTGGSVATLCLQLLHYFGCNPIVFVGQDLAYVESRSHFNQPHGIENIGAGHHVSVRSVTGENITTTISWNVFRRWIESFISQHSDRQYINASHGAEIRGTIHVDLRQVYDIVAT